MSAKTDALMSPTATSDGATAETQTTVAAHAQNEELRLCKFKVSEQGELIGRYSQLRRTR